MYADFIRGSVSSCACERTCVQMGTCVFVCVHVSVYMYVHVYVHVDMYVCIYTHTVLISSSIYTWYIHEDKGRLAKANRQLTRRLHETESELKRLQDLNPDSTPPNIQPDNGTPPVSPPLPSAPSGPEPQERDTRIIQIDSPEEPELKRRKDIGQGDLGGAGLSREGWTADNPEIAGVLEKGATGQLWYVGYM